MSLRVRAKPVFVFFWHAATRGTHITKSGSSRSSSTGSCASRDDTKDLASVNSEDHRVRRCIARRFSLDGPDCIVMFLVQLYLFWLGGCSAGSLLFFCQFFRAGVVTSFNVPSFYAFLDNRSAVIQPHPTKGAEIYCCI